MVWGTWLNARGRKITVSDKTETIDFEYEGSYPEGVKWKKISDHVVQGSYFTWNTETKTDDISTASFLFKVNGADSQVRGRVLNADGGPAPNKKVTLKNKRIPKLVKTATTGKDGYFAAKEILLGDHYELSVGDYTMDVLPYYSGESIGNISLAKESVKIHLEPADASGAFDQSLYPGQDYKFSLFINNIGTENCSAASYEIIYDSSLTITAPPPQLGTMEPNAVKVLPITINCAFVGGASEMKTVTVKVRDNMNSRVWEDTFTLLFNKTSLEFKITGSRVLVDMIVFTNNNAYFTEGSVKVPWQAEPYLVLCYDWLGTADVYSIGINNNPPKGNMANSYMDDEAGNPRNTEDTALSITLSESTTYTSYLHAGKTYEYDCDFYRVTVAEPGP
jgi:hypothetical protein